jgi:hypothetical protein
MALFSRPFTATSFLLHVAAINLIAARSAYLDGEAFQSAGSAFDAALPAYAA